MRRSSSIALFFSVLLGAFFLSLSIYAEDGQQQEVAKISDEEFSKLHKSLLPQEALWKTVPWQTPLLKAQNIAAREKKPIFIWSMDGHPLGCT